MKTTAELKGLSADGLAVRLTELKKELLKLNVQVATGIGSASSGKIKQTKKNIARILTILTEIRGGK